MEKKVNQLCNSRTDHIICKKNIHKIHTYACTRISNFSPIKIVSERQKLETFLPKKWVTRYWKKIHSWKWTKCRMHGFKPVITGWQDRRLTRFSQSSSEISMENLPVEITDVNWNNKGIMSWLVNAPTRWQLITPNATQGRHHHQGNQGSCLGWFLRLNYKKGTKQFGRFAERKI